VSHTFPRGRTNLFFCAGTPWQLPDSDLPPRMRQLELLIAFFWLSNAIDNPLPLIDIEANVERPNPISDDLKAD